jgi:hypothetical protein
MAGYEVAGAKRQHTTPPWTWNEKKKRWELDDSDNPGGAKPDHAYTCVQYTMAKLAGIAPDRTKKEVEEQKDENAEQLLTAAGYKKSNCAQCGCQEGGLKDCAVVYKSKDGTVFHVAAFDPDFCDWGGKLSSSGAIVRFEKPQDYVDALGEEERKDTTVECWCKPGAGPKTITDEALNKGAKGPPAAPPKGGCAFAFATIGAAILLVVAIVIETARRS